MAYLSGFLWTLDDCARLAADTPPAVNRGRGRGITKPPVRKKRRKRR